MDQIQKLAPQGVQVIIIGNKIDLASEREVETSEGSFIRYRFGKRI